MLEWQEWYLGCLTMTTAEASLFLKSFWRRFWATRKLQYSSHSCKPTVSTCAAWTNLGHHIEPLTNWPPPTTGIPITPASQGFKGPGHGCQEWVGPRCQQGNKAGLTGRWARGSCRRIGWLRLWGHRSDVNPLQRPSARQTRCQWVNLMNMTLLLISPGLNKRLQFRMCPVKASAAGSVGQRLMAYHVKEQDLKGSRTWFPRVPTQCNLSDFPSGSVAHALLVDDAGSLKKMIALLVRISCSSCCRCTLQLRTPRSL